MLLNRSRKSLNRTSSFPDSSLWSLSKTIDSGKKFCSWKKKVGIDKATPSPGSGPGVELQTGNGERKKKPKQAAGY